MDDERFKHVATDPKFRRIPKGARKVKIDKRFQSMFKDKKFQVKYTIDKRGRPVNHTSTEDLKRYYELSSESEEESGSENEPGKYVKAPGKNDEKSSSDSENDLKTTDRSDREIPKKIKKKLKNLKVDYARGESRLLSESSSDDDESDEDVLSESEEIEHKWGELDNDAESTEETTCRLAACNMDWDKIRAVDLMVLFNSFLPPGGAIKSVTIYPSEFGKQRMQEEEVKGPIELVENKKDIEEDTEEGSKYHMEKLRQYQLNRLKYFYAVIFCDSLNTANKIYTECDGMEYESSATKIDLRFIPDDLSFENDEIKETCDKLPELNRYQPRFFTTTALQQAKVDLTWDETDPDRIEITQKLQTGKLDDISENDLQNYLALGSGSSSSDEDDDGKSDENEDDENPIDKYKSLLQEIEEKENEKKNKDVEMEVSWGIDLKEKTEKLVKKKMLEIEDKTPFQKYLDKRKEKRKEKRKQKNSDDINEDSDDMPSDIDINDPYFAEELNNPEFKKANKKKNEINAEEENSQDDGGLELLLMNEEDAGKKHFNLKKIQDEEKEGSKKKKKKKNKAVESSGDDFRVNVNDERFSALFTSHLYNIDPTDPHFKKTKGMETLINEKIKRRNEDDEDNEPDNKKIKVAKKDAELSVLVKSVKRKAEALNSKVRK